MLSPIGYWSVSANDSALTSVNFTKKEPSLEKMPSQLTNSCITQLKRYFDKKTFDFSFPLDRLNHPPFYKSVWKVVEKIEYGKTISYSDIAKMLNNPNSVRAVGLANGKNPFPLIIPCHRVLGKDRSLTGYASGIEVKKWLLEHEGAIGIQKSLF